MYFEELQLGMAVDLAPATIEKDAMTEFALRYDHIPLHTDEEYAKTTPFGGLIAPGVMSFMSVWSRYLDVDFCREELLAGKSTKIEWHKPVYPGDTLSGRAEITALTPRSPKNGILELTLHIYNQHGVLVMTNVTEAIVKCRPQEG